jgi:hypothetical protein
LVDYDMPLAERIAQGVNVQIKPLTAHEKQTASAG